MDKEDVYAYTHREWNTTQTFKKWNHTICSSMGEPGINILSEVDRKRKTIFCDITHVWNLKGTYQWNRNRLTDIENRLVVAKEGRTGSSGLADEIYLYIEWIKNEVLQYGTGNSIRYLAISHNGKEYTCQAESTCCTAEMNYTSIFFLIFKNLWFLYLQWTLHDSKNAQTEMTKNTDQFWNMILSKEEEILRRETVLLPHCIHKDQEENQIYYLGSITNVNDPHRQQNGVESLPLLRFVSCLWTTAELAVCLPLASWNWMPKLGHFAPVWSWLLWTRPSLKQSVAWKSLLDIFCVHLSI